MTALVDDIKDVPNFADDSYAPDTRKAEMEDQNEVFKRGEGQVDFRTVSWIRAGVIFLKSELYLPSRGNRFRMLIVMVFYC
jgi:hypothetical protein